MSVQCIKNLVRFRSRMKQMLVEVERVSRKGSESGPNLGTYMEVLMRL